MRHQIPSKRQKYRKKSKYVFTELVLPSAVVFRKRPMFDYLRKVSFHTFKRPRIGFYRFLPSNTGELETVNYSSPLLLANRGPYIVCDIDPCATKTRLKLFKCSGIFNKLIILSRLLLTSLVHSTSLVIDRVLSRQIITHSYMAMLRTKMSNN